ncbi:TRAP transporter small permease [Pseudothermotoga sp.]|uniref:TRAP transporter small permease n=1 Tax=Pseudothermotoga sp. TaxID=2033661 RepID=UPI0031F71B8C
MNILKKIKNLFQIHLPAVCVLLLFSSMFVQVLLRYVFRHPSPEAFEISSYSFVWSVLLGAALANRYRNHIKFDILYNKFPRKVQIIVDIIFDSFFSALLTISLKPIVSQALWYRIIKSEVLGIPWVYLTLCLPIAMLLMIIDNCRFIFLNLRELIFNKPFKLEEKTWR